MIWKLVLRGWKVVYMVFQIILKILQSVLFLRFEWKELFRKVNYFLFFFASQIAARNAVAMTVFSRIVMATPGMCKCWFSLQSHLLLRSNFNNEHLYEIVGKVTGVAIELCWLHNLCRDFHLFLTEKPSCS